MDFNDIFTEYYTLYRGQAANIPKYGDREYNTAIILANSAIKKWDRADGILWNELVTTLGDEDGIGSISDGTTEYDAPTNMRKPPGFVTINGQVFKTVRADEVDQYTANSPIVYFTGSPARGFTMHVLDAFATQNDGKSFDYIYTKQPATMSLAEDPSDFIPDMSDPTFMIQDMVASRAQQQRNGFLFKTATNAATAALANMKLENYSGTANNNQRFQGLGSGWGASVGSRRDIRL